MAEEGKDQVVKELAKLSDEDDDDGESSTVVLENQLDHLQTLLAQAETEVGAKGITASVTTRITDTTAFTKPNPADLAELNSILGEPENILHLTTPENILDVLGFSEETKRPAKKKHVEQPPVDESRVLPEDTKQVCGTEKKVSLDTWISSQRKKPKVTPKVVKESPPIEKEKGISDIVTAPRNEEEKYTPPAAEEDQAKPVAWSASPDLESESALSSSPDSENVCSEAQDTEESMTASEEENEQSPALTEPEPIPPLQEQGTTDLSELESSGLSDETSFNEDQALEEAIEEVMPQRQEEELTVLEQPNVDPDSDPGKEAAVAAMEEVALAPAPRRTHSNKDKINDGAHLQPELERIAGDHDSHSNEQDSDVAPMKAEKERAVGDDDVEVVLEDHEKVQDDMPAEEESIVEQEEVNSKDPVKIDVEPVEETKEEEVGHEEAHVPSEEEQTETEGNEREHTKEKHHTIDIALESVEEEKKEDDSIEVLVLPELGDQQDDPQETGSVEVVLPGMSSQSQEMHDEDTNVANKGVQAQNAPLAVEFEERDIVAATSDTILVQSSKLLADLKHEVKKLRADYHRVEENNKRLSQANSSAEALFESLNQHAQQLQKKLEETQAEVAKANAALAESKTVVGELKGELAMKQAKYGAEVQARLRCQKALQEMADLVQNTCKDSAFVEQVLSLADKVEEETMAVPAMKTIEQVLSLADKVEDEAMAVPAMKTTEETNSVAESTSATEETPTVENKTKAAKEQGGYMSYIKACVWTT